jgi:hypothetical protein
MWERIKCPSCSAGLILQDSARGSGATCPRCLAMVSVPETGREPDAIRAERPEWGEESSWCPHCGRTVEALWLTCPWCEEPLRGRERGRNNAPDIDVRRDMKGTSCFVIGLAGIGVLGILVLGGQTFSWAAESNVTPLVYFVVALLFLAGLSTLIVFLRSRGNPGASGVRRVIVGTLALAGVGTLVLLLVIFSIIVYICIVCSQHTGSPL